MHYYKSPYPFNKICTYKINLIYIQNFTPKKKKVHEMEAKLSSVNSHPIILTVEDKHEKIICMNAGRKGGLPLPTNPSPTVVSPLTIIIE